MRIIIGLVLFLVATSCSRQVEVSTYSDEIPVIFPDYADVVIPPNIAPLNFSLEVEAEETRALFKSEDAYEFEIAGKNGSFNIPLSKWKNLLKESMGGNVSVTIKVKNEDGWTAYKPFFLHVAKERIDSYLAYRLIAPGYELWNGMGIYQRDLENFTQESILENKVMEHNCINCHSFCMQQANKMLFHMRGKIAGTMLFNNGKYEKLNTKTNRTISPLVYPSWHPSGKYIAFSVNKTNQNFHLNHRNRIEVYDEASDVVIYDIEKHELLTSSSIFSEESFETFPAFSPDGNMLYFCSAKACSIPEEYDKVKYNLCAVSFNPQTREFGTKVDTLFCADRENKSASFPRVSPDGRWLMYTASGYGNFSIWHKDADLHLIDLLTGTSKVLTEVNSEDVESYHSWSSNSRWFVFSSRRLDGLYTHPYIAYVDEKGIIGKPFVLPQQDACFYDSFMWSFNIPEFVTSKIADWDYGLVMKVKEDRGIDIKFE
ncbi:MAG: hypothetical protein PHG06_11080 [Parabacteroides sp.]|nr:hypothetical protein [Parabacteroides sp.]